MLGLDVLANSEGALTVEHIGSDSCDALADGVV